MKKRDYDQTVVHLLFSLNDLEKTISNTINKITTEDDCISANTKNKNKKTKILTLKDKKNTTVNVLNEFNKLVSGTIEILIKLNKIESNINTQKSS